MLEIEQLCTSELGLTEDMLSENAGRSIAEAVLRSSTDVRNVVFLVGNHKSGARAIAAARHLRNRRLRITVVILGGEREELLLEIVRRQLSIYKKGQGYVDRWDELQTKLSNGGPQPDVVVDAILGVHVAFDELRTDDQATTFEMIRWASRLSTVLSVDVPSGLSATSGLITEAEGQLLVMNSKQVVALGAPKVGLLHAMAMDGAEASWNVVVADIGISTAAWQKHGSRRKHGIEFGTDWVVPVKFVTG
jgi:enhancer of mRNA-decapping protein 3